MNDVPEAGMFAVATIWYPVNESENGNSDEQVRPPLDGAPEKMRGLDCNVSGHNEWKGRTDPERRGPERLDMKHSDDPIEGFSRELTDLTVSGKNGL